ncbi:hypothetical protein CKO36_18330 [Rhabdochromatium marinum]|nr:hypothetical protein [Rhabdochromatium marinum]
MASIVLPASGAWSAQRTLLETAIRRVRCEDLRRLSSRVAERMTKADKINLMGWSAPLLKTL